MFMHALGIVRSAHINENAAYNPATQGAIQSFDFSEDVRTFSTEATTFGGSTKPALRQNGVVYVHNSQTPTRNPPSDSLPSPWMGYRS